MKLSPMNIKNQQFGKSVRGFDPEEVKAFLVKLADEIDNLQEENSSLKKQLDEANIKLQEFGRIERGLKETFLKAQETSSQAVEEARKRSSIIIKEAETKAARILEKARQSANEIKNSVMELREEKNLIVARLKAIINSQARLLDIKASSAQVEQEETQEEREQIKLEQKEKVNINTDKIVEKLSSL